MSELPAIKRARIALEALPEVPIASVAPDGTESYDTEETPHEKFWSVVKLIDFSQPESSKGSVTSDAGTTSAKHQLDWTWATFQASVSTASREVEYILQLVDWLRENKNITTYRVVKPDLPPRIINAEFSASVSSRKTQFTRSQQLLEAARDRLRGTIAKADSFFTQVLELRKIWRIIGPEKQPLGGYHPQFYVDISFVHDGSRMRVAPIPLQKSVTGDIMIEHNPSFPMSSIHIETGDGSSAGEGCWRDTMFSIPKLTKFVGVKECHDYLCMLQQSMWNMLVFKQMAREFMNQSDFPEVFSSDSSVRLHLMGLDESVTMRLVRRSDSTLVENADSMAVDSSSPSPALLLPALTALSQERKSAQDLFLSAMLEICLHQSLHSSHTEKLKRDTSPNFTSKSILERLQKEPFNIAKTVRSTVRHLALTEKVALELNKLRDGLSRSLGATRVRWYPTASDLVSTCDFEYAVRFCQSVTIRDSQIFVQSHRVIATPTELVQYLHKAVCQYVIEQLFSQSRALLGAGKVSVDGLSLSVHLERYSSKFRMSVAPQEYSVQVTLLEEESGMRSEEADDDLPRYLEWSGLPGGNHLEKFTELVLQRGMNTGPKST